MKIDFSQIKRHAVIDIGSNSVRLVIYRVLKASFIPIHNEKVLAALGEGLSETGKLSPKGVEMAIDALKRYRILLNSLEIETYEAIATAAVRAAADGGDFALRVKNEIGLDIEIIGGHDEGRLSALGVKSGSPFSTGFMGDLGGSSLELVPLEKNPKVFESWPLGPLAFGEMANAKNIVKDPSIMCGQIRAILAQSEVLKLNNLDEFHAVGGAWRTIGHIHMVIRNYGLRVLQNYKIERSEIIALCDFLMTQGKKSLEKIDGVSSRRADSIPYAACLLRELVNLSNCNCVIISSYGLREGVLSEKLSNIESLEQQFENSLSNGAIAIGAKREENFHFSQSLFEWLKPLINHVESPELLEKHTRLIKAAVYLVNIGENLHPDHRAELAFEMVLRAPFAAANHNERVFLASLISYRYGAKTEEILKFDVTKLLEASELKFAEIYGLAFRLATNLTANSDKILRKTKLSINSPYIELVMENDLSGLYSIAVEKRLNSLANVCGLSKL